MIYYDMRWDEVRFYDMILYDSMWNVLMWYDMIYEMIS